MLHQKINPLWIAAIALLLLSVPVDTSAPAAQPPGGPPPDRFNESEDSREPNQDRPDRRRRGFDPFGDIVPSEKRLDPEELAPEDGAASIPDWETFDKFSYTGPEVMIDAHLAHQQFVKFQIERVGTDLPAQMYFINTKTHRAHPAFMRRVGLMQSDRRGGRGNPSTMRGVLIYHPDKKSPNGQMGLFTFEYEPNDRYAFDRIKLSHDLLIEHMPMLKDRLAYFPMPGGVPQAEQDKELYDASEVVLLFEKDMETNVGYLPLNPGTSFGRLQWLKPDISPAARDIVICTNLPNEMPRVAGILSAVRQTPLSHVNLRAVQDGAPNAYIAGANENAKVTDLIGKYVHYAVNKDRFTLREATAEEVDAYFDSIRPKQPQTPVRDLSVKTIRPLTGLQFTDSRSVGVKAANLAAMHAFGLPEGTLPDGYAVPFHFYVEFMKHNGLFAEVQTLLDDAFFEKPILQQQVQLAALRAKIKASPMPDWMSQALHEVYQSWPEGTSLRCRSSTNNEDLEGFSGAGLYGSFTHHPQEGPLDHSIKQVFASLWYFRAVEERQFYRINHLETAMGVLIHPNYSGERANGVGVTEDILYGTRGNHYLNTQVGEDLVTNPDPNSVPEEILLSWTDAKEFKLMRSSSLNTTDQPLLDENHREQLRVFLGKIHARFARLYQVDLQDAHFAMEIEYKITADGQIAIKQARPWVFAEKATESVDE